MMIQPKPEKGLVHVLVVEDEVVVRALLAEELRSAGFAVIEAGNADDALVYMRSSGPVDLVFSDVQMPGSLDGLQFADQVRNDYPTIPIILTSGDGSMASRVNTGHFISKPYKITSAIALVFSTLGLTPPES